MLGYGEGGEACLGRERWKACVSFVWMNGLDVHSWYSAEWQLPTSREKTAKTPTFSRIQQKSTNELQRIEILMATLPRDPER